MTIEQAEALGRAAYNAFHAGVKLRRFERRKGWEELTSDQRQAWRRAADAVRACVDLERGPR